jgi:MFS transporter, DHA3 family, multidrug efflux protein
MLNETVPASTPGSMRLFYQVLGNTLVASVSTVIVWFALTFWAYLQTGSVIVTSVLAVMFFGGNLLTGFVFGSLVDRYSKKTLILVTDAITAGIFVVSFLIYVTTPAEAFTSVTSPSLWLLIVVAFSGVILPNIRGIIQATLVPALVPADQLDRANGMAGMVLGLSFFIGSLFSGFLIATSGMTWVLLIPILVRVGTIVHVWRLPIPQRARVETTATEGMPQEDNRTFDLRGTFRIVNAVPGLFALLLFTCLNNFLGGVYGALLDPYGLSMVSAEAWGVISAVLGLGFILGGAIIAKRGLGANPLRSLFLANIVIWASGMIFTIQPSILLLLIGYLLFPMFSPFIEAAEHTIIQKVVPPDRHGRVFGFAQSIESAASPVSTLLVGPLAQFIFIPFMTTGAGVELIGGWFGVGEPRGMALLFTIAGFAGVVVTLVAMQSNVYRRLGSAYMKARHSEADADAEQPQLQPT